MQGDKGQREEKVELLCVPLDNSACGATIIHWDQDRSLSGPRMRGSSTTPGSVIPTIAGILLGPERGTGTWHLPGTYLAPTTPVTPAKAGVTGFSDWIPAFAGMTDSS
jgi:hypothetical protein